MSNFLNSLHTFGTPITPAKRTLATPPAELFVKAVQTAIADILLHRKSKWVRYCNGSYEITLRNGSVAIELGGARTRLCKDSRTALAYLNAAAESAKAGELDAIFAETQLKKSSKK